MATRHAQVLTDAQFKRALAYCDQYACPPKSRVMLLLSFRAGLRAQEIAGLRWCDVTDANGVIGKHRGGAPSKKHPERYLFVGSHIGKYGKERTLVMVPELHTALVDLREHYGRTKPDEPVIRESFGRGHMSPDSVRKWFERFYKRLNLQGCSSHSGRRTLITRLSRNANLYNCSLRDVQMIAGHASIKTTEHYMEASPNVTKLMESA